MQITRTPIVTGDFVDVDTLADHLRLEAIEAANAMRYATTAGLELERHANLALLDTTIIVETDKWPGYLVETPIHPFNANVTPTVEQVELDGSTTAITEGWMLHGSNPLGIIFETEPVGPIRVTYQAGYGADHTAIPTDLKHAILDQALRLYDLRGDVEATSAPAPAFARISARHRRVRLGV